MVKLFVMQTNHLKLYTIRPMKAIITVEVEIEDNYVKKRNDDLQRNYKCCGNKYKSGEDALKNYPLQKGIADIIEDCLRHKQEGLLYCNVYAKNK